MNPWVLLLCADKILDTYHSSIITLDHRESHNYFVSGAEMEIGFFSYLQCTIKCYVGKDRIFGHSSVALTSAFDLLDLFTLPNQIET